MIAGRSKRGLNRHSNSDKYRCALGSNRAAHPAKRILDSAGVAPAFQEREDGDARFGLGPQRALLHELAFERGEEAFHHDVIEAITGRPGRGHHPHLPAPLGRCANEVYCDSPGIPGGAARQGPEAPRRYLQKPRGWSGSGRATPLVALGTTGMSTASPRAVPAGGHARHSAHRGRPMMGLIRLHELEDLPGIGPVSRANQAAAFLGISRSSRSGRCSRRSRRSSSSSRLVRPSSRRPSSRSA